MTGVPHHDLFALSALPGHRGDAGVGHAGRDSPGRQELGRFGEHRGRHTTVNSHQRTKNPDIARRPARPRGDTALPKTSKQGVDLPPTAQPLLTHQAQARKQQRHVGARGFDGPRGHRKRRGPERREHGGGIEPPDPMGAEDLLEARPPQPRNGMRSRHDLEQRLEPELGGRRARARASGGRSDGVWSCSRRWFASRMSSSRKSSSIREYSRSSMITGSSSRTRRNAGRSVRSEAAKTNASSRSSLARPRCIGRGTDRAASG